jgi:hypothetical protein
MVNGLGNSASSVATDLGRAGVRGTPGNTAECPMARYLHAVIGGESSVDQVLVFDSSVRVTRVGLRPSLVVSLPSAVSAFIRGFDAGCFPDLVSGNERDRARPAAPLE